MSALTLAAVFVVGMLAGAVALYTFLIAWVERDRRITRPRLQRPPTRWVPMYDDLGNECGMRIEHDGPCVFVDGSCSCGRLSLGLDEAERI